MDAPEKVGEKVACVGRLKQEVWPQIIQDQTNLESCIIVSDIKVLEISGDG